jgi:hypothetical protein
MSTMDFDGLRTDAPPSMKRCLWSPRRWAISLASLLVASCGDFIIEHPPGETPQGPTQRDAAVDAPVDVAADAPVDAPRVCDTTGLVCAGAATAVVCGAHCWARCDALKIASDAQFLCKGWGGALGEINSLADQDCVPSLLVDLQADRRTWLGLQQQDNATAVGAGWTWNPSPGVPLTITNWAKAQPDDGDTTGSFVENHVEQCMDVETNGFWHDAPCDALRLFLCRRR